MNIAPAAPVIAPVRAVDPAAASASDTKFSAYLDDATRPPATRPASAPRSQDGKSQSARSQDRAAPAAAKAPGKGRAAQDAAPQDDAQAAPDDAPAASGAAPAPVIAEAGEEADLSATLAETLLAGDEAAAATPAPALAADATDLASAPEDAVPLPQPAPAATAPAASTPPPPSGDLAQEDAEADMVATLPEAVPVAVPRKPAVKTQGAAQAVKTRAADTLPMPATGAAMAPVAAPLALRQPDQGEAAPAEGASGAIAAKADPRAAAEALLAARDAVEGEARNAAPAPASAEAMPSALLTQALPGDAARGGSFNALYGAQQAQSLSGATTPANPATIAAEAGRLGRDMGVEIARHVGNGRDEVFVRMDPPEMGRVEVRLSFDRDNGLRAVVAADNQATLSLLKRESGDLARALQEAGVRSDSQSFRFDSRSGGDGGQTPWRQPQSDGSQGRGAAGPGVPAEDLPAYRPLRASGRIDMMA